MVWIKRRYDKESWSSTQLMERVEQEFMTLGGPKEMLMIEETHEPLVSTIWIRHPNEVLAAAYDGFENADPADLPKQAILLIGHNSEFEKQFEYGPSRGS